MGGLLRHSSTIQRLSTGLWEAEHAQGPEHRRSVLVTPIVFQGLTKAEGELLDLIEEFSDGRIQFAFVRVKDPNTSLPKFVLIAWVRVQDSEGAARYVTDCRTVVWCRGARAEQGQLWQSSGCSLQDSPCKL